MADRSARYVSKGGIILGIAAFSQSRNIQRWDSLGPALRHPVEKLVSGLAGSGELLRLADAIRQGATQPVVSVPPWVSRCVEHPSLLSQIGDAIVQYWPVDSHLIAPKGAEGGRMALAVALCRNPEVAKVTSELFVEPLGQQFWDVASLAAVLAPAGYPSEIRRQIRALMAALDEVQTDVLEGWNGETD